MCLFNIDNNFNTCCEFTGSCPVTGSVGECVVQQREICDGKSECLTDECGCTDIVTNRSTGNMSHDVHRQITARRTGVFWCADGSGCIAFANLCDGHRHCVDGSDECMCGDIVMCCPTHSEGAGVVMCNNNNQYCVPRQHYCSKRDDYKTCTLLNDI